MFQTCLLTPYFQNVRKFVKDTAFSKGRGMGKNSLITHLPTWEQRNENSWRRAERWQKQLFLGRVMFLLYCGYNFCSVFKTKSSPYNVTVFDNRSSFNGEEIWYTTFASWEDPITDKLFYRDGRKMWLQWNWTSALRETQSINNQSCILPIQKCLLYRFMSTQLILARDHITSHTEKELRQQKTTGQAWIHNLYQTPISKLRQHVKADLADEICKSCLCNLW